MSDMPPPTSPVVDAFVDSNPGWPKVVGIISIVWGSLGLCCGGCGLASAAGMMPKQPGMESMPTGGTPLAYASLAFGLLVTLVLLTAGILTLSRKPIGKILHLVYAIMAFISVILAAVAQIQVIGLMEQWMRDNADSPQVKQMSQIPMATIQKGGLVVGLIIASIYPIFCAIWFGVVKRNADMGSNEVSI